MGDSGSQLVADLDRFTSSHSTSALLCGVAAGFVVGGLFGAWLAARRKNTTAPRGPRAPLTSISTGAVRHHNVPSELGSLPVTPRTDDGTEHSEVKMVLIVRQDLKMGKGKIAAQCCHATLGQFKKLWRRKDPNLKKWELSGQTKVCLRVDDEDGFMQLHQAARSAGIPAHIVVDAGRTQIAPDSKTVMALGPADADLIDSVSGHLKLL
ncbi:hypothetical protein WJX81_002872 [Elliptochloris bilobata]|uniref:peptidyl-tRNA hydrolase n=1 Tax=Elliptochloris bilobata TaxID=381761 RepID=A0AAW1S6T7_9CHLO